MPTTFTLKSGAPSPFDVWLPSGATWKFATSTATGQGPTYTTSDDRDVQALLRRPLLLDSTGSSDPYVPPAKPRKLQVNAANEVEQVDAENYRVAGDLTIKGVTKPVTVDFEYTGAAVDPFDNQRIGLEGKTTVNRKEWGVNWNAALEAGGVLVSEKVTLEFEVSAIRTGHAS